MTDAPVSAVPVASAPGDVVPAAPPVSLADMAAAATQVSADPALGDLTAPVAVVPTPAPEPVEQNPLDALEAILQQAKAKADTTTEVLDPNAPPAPDPAIEAAAEEARKHAEFVKLEAENKLLDEANLKAELEALKNVSDTSAEQARLAQQNALQQDQQQRREEHDANQIRQLNHTKI